MLFKTILLFYIHLQTFVAQKFGFAAEIQALQGSPNDKDIIDLCGHYGLGAMAVNAAMRSRYAAKNGRGLQKARPYNPRHSASPSPCLRGTKAGRWGNCGWRNYLKLIFVFSLYFHRHVERSVSAVETSRRIRAVNMPPKVSL